jgi:ABC-type glycerol-3-phosphate transport system substrate-binding protein
MSEEKKQKMSRREFLRSASILAALPLIASCGGPATPAPSDTGASEAQPAEGEAAETKTEDAAAPAGEPVKITMWTWYTEQEQEFPKLVEEFNEANPNIEVENRIYGGEEYLQVLEAAIAGGTGPDILGPHVHAIEYGLAGQTVALNDTLGEEFLSQFFPSTRRQFTAEGKQYAIGWMAQTFGFFYNPPMLEAAGVEVPGTWDELIAASAGIKETGAIPWAFNESDKWLGADFFLPLITQVTDNPDLVYELDDHTTGASWDSEPVIEALGLIPKLVEAGVFQEGVNGTDWSQSTALFYSGKAAQFFAGSWVPQGIATDAPPELAEAYRVFKTPAWASGKKNWCGNQAGAALAINAKGHIPESAEYIKFIYEPERYSRTMNNSLSMPSTSASAEQVDSPIMKEMTSWLVDGAPHILFGKGSWDAVSNAVQGVFGLTLTPADAAKQIEADVVAARSR